jgi:putative transposase
MGRPLRIQYPGAFYHITSRGNEKRDIFKSNGDREKFLSYLQSAHERYGGIIHVYCLMDNHYHLLLETPRSNLSQILHHINSAYTIYFNIKRRRSGHLFQGRYKAILLDKDAYCQELSRYIHLNPVRAGLVNTLLAYPWSSYPSYIGSRQGPEWLTTDFVLRYFGGDEPSARENYQKFVEGALDKESKNPLKDVFASTILGTPEFISWVREKMIELRDPDIRNVPALRGLVRKPSLEQIERTVKSLIGQEHPLCERFCMYVSQHHGGYALKEIGAHYGMRGPAVSQSNRRLGQSIIEDPRLKEVLGKIVEKIK